jgi:hypothetical protein
VEGALQISRRSRARREAKRAFAIESELAEFEHALSNLMLHMSARHIKEALAIRSGYRISRACWAIVEYLKAHCSMRAKTLANMLGVGAPALSQHLKMMGWPVILFTRDSGQDIGRPAHQTKLAGFLTTGWVREIRR